MKLIVAFLALLCCIHMPANAAPAPSEKPARHEYDFVWGDAFTKLPHDPKMTIGTQGGGLALVYFGEEPTDMELQTIGPAFLTTLQTSQFAIEGTITYYKLLPGSFLEMWCYFAPEKPGDPETAYMTRTLAMNDPMSKVAGWEQDKHFQLPFDIRGAKTPLKRVILKVHLAGGYDTHIVLNNVKMIEYSNDTFPSTVASVRTLPPVTPLAPDLQVIADLPIEKYLPSDQDQKDLSDNFHDGNSPSDRLLWKQEDKAQVTYPKEPDGTTGLLLVRSGPGDDRTAVLTVPQDTVAQITGTRYGITGEVSYSGVKRGALVMVSCFSRVGLTAPMDQWYGGMEGHLWGAKDDAMGLMEGTREWGNFYLGFDREYTALQQHSALDLKRLVLSVILDGPGTVHLRNLKLVQYPEPLVPLATRTPIPTQATAMTVAPCIDWKSFLLGVVATGASLLAGGGFLFVSRRWNRRRHERELRRIASMDG